MKPKEMKPKEIYNLLTQEFGDIPEMEEEAQKWFNEKYLLATKESKRALVELFFYNVITIKDDNDKLLWNFRALENGYDDLEKRVKTFFYENYGDETTNNFVFKYFEERALKNDISSIIFLGNIYSGGINVDKDKDIAHKWYEKAALLGNSGSQLRMGEYFLLKKDYKEALFWFNKAATLGNKVAYIKMARIYKEGVGVKQDLEKAKLFLKKALKKKVEKKSKLLFTAQKKSRKK